MRLSGTRIVLFAVAALCAFGAMTFASAEVLTTTVSVSMQDLSLERSGEFDVVRLAGLLTTHAEGYPELPLELVRFALPDGMVAVRAEARVLSKSAIPGSYLVRPRQPEVPLSMPELARAIDPDETAYASRMPYPEQSCVLLGSGNAGGQGIATVAFHPIQYVAGRGQLTLNERTEITLTIEPARRNVRMPGVQSPESAKAAADRSRSLVVNPEDVIDRTAGPRAGRGEVDYLVITSSSYAPIFQDLADWKEQKGLTTEVVTTTWVYANYGGVDQQEQIRNCIIDYYENKGTVWVLLGGDTGVVPERTVFAMDSGVGGAADEDKLRCDLYYGDLDGTWDGNGNGTYGQITLDDIDMYADVFVGRAPVDNTTEATRFVNKTLTYEGAPGGDPLPTDYQLDMLFMAEVLWDSPWTDHAICKNMIDDDSVPARFDPVTKLYQTSGNLSTSSAVSAMNNGYNIVNHNGHANTTVLSIGSGALYRSHFDGLTNAPEYGLFYSMGCWSAAIDKDCIAEHWNNSPNGGGIAYIGNSRYGWGSPGNPGDGNRRRVRQGVLQEAVQRGARARGRRARGAQGLLRRGCQDERLHTLHALRTQPARRSRDQDMDRESRCRGGYARGRGAARGTQAARDGGQGGRRRRRRDRLPLERRGVSRRDDGTRRCGGAVSGADRRRNDVGRGDRAGHTPVRRQHVRRRPSSGH